MSGSTIGGVVGGFVGLYFGNPQLGWMIGSAIGGYVDPEQISVSGPRLQDAATQTSQDGIPIPFGYGSFPTRGNIIWCGPVVEGINTETESGKGGPEVTTTTYVQLRAYAIGICQGPIAGLLVVKRNGKVIYDKRTAEELTALGYTDDQINEIRALTHAFENNNEIYLGDETQTASPTIEAHEGVGNVPAMRGLAYFVVPVDNVTELAGAVPQYEFVVSQCGDVVTTCLDMRDPTAAPVAYLLLDNDDTDETYAQADYDYSSWDTGLARFDSHEDVAVTLIPQGKRLWVRHELVLTSTTGVDFVYSADDEIKLWINGVEVLDTTGFGTFPIDPADLQEGCNHIAISNIDNGGGRAYLTWEFVQ